MFTKSVWSNCGCCGLLTSSAVREKDVFNGFAIAVFWKSTERCLPNNGCNYLLLSGWRCANYSAIDLLSVCFPDNGRNYLLLSGIRCVNYITIDLPGVCIFVCLMCESMSTNADRVLEDTGGHVPIARIRARDAISR